MKRSEPPRLKPTKWPRIGQFASTSTQDNRDKHTHTHQVSNLSPRRHWGFACPAATLKVGDIAPLVSTISVS